MCARWEEGKGREDMGGGAMGRQRSRGGRGRKIGKGREGEKKEEIRGKIESEEVII